MLKLENGTWADCRLGNIARKAQQFNLLDEKRKSEGKRERKKEEKGGEREKERLE